MVGAPKNTVPVPEVPQQPPTNDLVGNLLNSLKTPEGVRLITNLIGAASGDPYVGAGIAGASEKQYELAKQQQALADKEQSLLKKMVKKQQDDIDAEVETFRRKEKIKEAIAAPEKQRELEKEQKLDKKKAVNAIYQHRKLLEALISY